MRSLDFRPEESHPEAGLLIGGEPLTDEDSVPPPHAALVALAGARRNGHRRRGDAGRHGAAGRGRARRAGGTGSRDLPQAGTAVPPLAPHRAVPPGPRLGQVRTLVADRSVLSSTASVSLLDAAAAARRQRLVRRCPAGGIRRV